MALVTTGLTNGGLTTHYQIQYDDSLSQADGKDRANALIAVCEADYNLMSGWFGGIALTVGTPVTVNITPGPYASAGWGPPIRLTPGDGSSVAVVRYLLVSEVTEMFMLAQNRGWFAPDGSNEQSCGEGLSRFLAQQFLVLSGLGVSEPGFALASSWLDSSIPPISATYGSRGDFVNHTLEYDHGIDPATGCSILFIYYLFTQLGYSINSIIAAAPGVASASSCLRGVYQNLTGDASDPFPFFKQLLDTAFPPNVPATIPGQNPDNPFPLPLWTQIPGTLARISAGSRTNVWGVNSAGNIFRYTQDDANPWIQVAGGLSDVGAAADGTVWGVNSAGNIFRYSDNGTWTQISGALTRISAGSRTNVWGVNSAGNIFRYTQNDANPWVQVAGGLSDVGAAADGTVWGVNSAGNIFRYSDNGTWTKISGGLTRISAGSRTNVWGVNSAGNIFRYTQDDANPWVQVPGGLSDIGAAADGTVWGVNSAGNIYRYIQDDANPWIQVPGGLSDVGAAADGTVWGVNSAGNIFRYSDNGTWTQISGGLTRISAGSRTNVWGVNSAGNIFRYVRL